MDLFKKRIQELKLEFITHNSRILRANKTVNINKRLSYTLQFIESYNKFIQEINLYFDRVGYVDKQTIRADFIYFKGQVLKYIGSYNIPNFPLPTDGYHKIEIEESALRLLITAGLVHSDPIDLDSEEETIEVQTQEVQTDQTENNMATPTTISKLEFVNACARTIPHNFDGNFDTLRSFLNKINFLKELAVTPELLNTLKIYVLTKLDQKALSKVDENPESVDVIINCLRAKVKHDSSKVLEGRMTALTLDHKPITDFQTEAKTLSDNYQQALVEEGIPLAIAEKLAIEKTVELCRKNTKCAEVKAILSATAHSDTASVIAKLVTGIDAVRQERLIEKGSKNNSERPSNGRNGFSRGRGRGRGNFHNRDSDRSNSNHGNGRGGYNNGRGGNNGYNNNNGNNGHNNGGRGRGRGRGFGNGNGRGFHNNNQFYQPPEQQIFYTLPGNGQMPLPQGATHGHHNTQHSS